MSPDIILIRVHGTAAGYLIREGSQFTVRYLPSYAGSSISLALPVRNKPYVFSGLPPFFDGLLPEGVGLEGLLRTRKLDRDDWMGQLLAVGQDVPGSVTLEATDEDAE